MLLEDCSLAQFALEEQTYAQGDEELYIQQILPVDLAAVACELEIANMVFQNEFKALKVDNGRTTTQI